MAKISGGFTVGWSLSFLFVISFHPPHNQKEKPRQREVKFSYQRIYILQGVELELTSGQTAAPSHGHDPMKYVLATPANKVLVQVWVTLFHGLARIPVRGAAEIMGHRGCWKGAPEQGFLPWVPGHMWVHTWSSGRSPDHPQTELWSVCVCAHWERGSYSFIRFSEGSVFPDHF